MALASMVLPVPGGPIKRMPLGSTPPSRLYFLGFFRKSTTSWTSALASSTPATSLKRTVGRALILWLVLDLSRSEEHPSELQSPCNLVCCLLRQKKFTCHLL